MANSKYALPTDNIASLPTWALGSGAVDPNYGLDYLFDGSPLLQVKFTGDTADITADFTTAKQIKAISIHGHNFKEGLNIRAQKHTSNSWGTPDVDVAVTVAAQQADGLSPDIFCDLSTTSDKRWFRLSIPSNDSVNLVIGEIWIWTEIREFPYPFILPIQDDEEQDAIVIATNMKVEHSFARATRQRIISGQVQSTQASDAIFLEWHRSCGGRLRPTVIVVDPSIPEARHVKFTNNRLARNREWTELSKITLEFRDTPRGPAV